jgi:hypothetical protein
MVNQYAWIGIAVGVFIAGIGIGYAVFPPSFGPGNMMMQNQQMMQTMMQDPQFRQQMIGPMMMGSSPIEQHESMLEMMEVMTENEDLMNHMHAHMLENEKMVHQMLTMMDQNPHLKEHMTAHVSGDLSEYEYLDEIEHKDHGHEDEHQ